MKIKLRLSILSMMVIVGLVAAILGWVAADRRRKINALTADFSRSEDRLRWAEAMQRKGYVSKAQVAADRARHAEIESQLDTLGASPRKP